MYSKKAEKLIFGLAQIAWLCGDEFHMECDDKYIYAGDEFVGDKSLCAPWRMSTDQLVRMTESGWIWSSDYELWSRHV